jgi:hypothetical protein
MLGLAAADGGSEARAAVEERLASSSEDEGELHATRDNVAVIAMLASRLQNVPVRDLLPKRLLLWCRCRQPVGDLTAIPRQVAPSSR